MRVLLVGALAAGILAVGDPASSAAASGVANVAHRGASRAAPENTLSSVVRAVAERADFVEVDVRLTKDGVPVVLHDASLARVTDVESVFPDRSPWLVRDFTLAEVRRLDAGSWKGRSYRGERVPTLATVMDQLSQSPSGAYVEIKDPAEQGWVDGIGAAVHDSVTTVWPTAWEGSGSHRVLILSADPGFIRDFSTVYPQVPLSVVQKTLSGDSLPLFADDVTVNHQGLTPDAAGVARDAGLTVGAWTVDDRQAMAGPLGYVDAITTNMPGLLREVLADRAETFTGTAWPAADTDPPSWRVDVEGHYLGRPVTVLARLARADGSPGRWARAAVQRRGLDGRWRTVASRGTDVDGSFSVELAGRPDLVVRVVSLDSDLYPRARSTARRVPLVVVENDIRLGGTRRVLTGQTARLAVRWLTVDGRPMSGKVRLFARRRGEPWRHVRDLLVSDGLARTTVRPGRRTTFYRVRSRATWWRSAAADDVRVRVVS